MATSGPGDVLTGLTVAPLCQKLAPFDAARLAAHLPGPTGDLAAHDGQPSLIARNPIDFLPLAFKKFESCPFPR